MTALTDSSAGAGGTAMSVGQLLRTRRLERGLEVSDISAETKIPARFLCAIEDDQHEKLPALPFAVGFVRNYAKMLGLQPDAVCAQFKAETSRLTPTEQVYFPEPLDESRIPSKALVLGGVALTVAAVGLWWGWSSRTPSPEPTAVATGESQQALTIGETSGTATTDMASADSTTGTTGVDTAATGAAAPVDGAGMAAATTGTDASAPVAVAAGGTTNAPSAVVAHEKAEAQAAAAAQVINSGPVIIRAVDDSWVRISDGVSGAVKIGIMKAGETYRVPALPNLKLMTGNAGAVEIQVGDVTLPPLGNRGEVIRNIDLNPESLRQLARSRSGGAAAR